MLCDAYLTGAMLTGNRIRWRVETFDLVERINLVFMAFYFLMVLCFVLSLPIYKTNSVPNLLYRCATAGYVFDPWDGL